MLPAVRTMRFSEGRRRLAIGRIGLVALAVAIGFAVAVLIVPGDPLALHESAGAILLFLLVAAVVLSARAGHGSRSLLTWAVAALAALLVMGGTGALLALGLVPLGYSFLPLLPLAALVALLAGLVGRARRPADGVARPPASRR